MKRIVVALAHRLHRAEAGHAEGDHRSLRSSADHHVGVVPLDAPERFPDRMTASRTGGHQTEVRTAGTVADRNVAGGEIPDHHRNQQRRDFARTTLDEKFVLLAHRVEAADAAGDDHPDPVRINAAAAQFLRKPGGLHRFIAGRNGVLTEKVQPFGLLRRHILRDVKILDLTGNLRTVLRRIKAGDPAQTAPAVDQGIPEIRYIVADAGHHAVTGNHYPSIVHTYFISPYSGADAVPAASFPPVAGTGNRRIPVMKTGHQRTER